MLSYTFAKDYLDSFINYEKDTSFSYDKDLKLERVKICFNKLGINCQKLKVIHIAGTKGKGSVATFIASILASSGFKVGLYTSPHFNDFRERIRILRSQNSGVSPPNRRFGETSLSAKGGGAGSQNTGIKNSLVSKTDIVKIVERFRPVLEKMRFTKRWGRLSFFEVYTAIAFKYFLQKQVDFAVLETGMGGRLDATNIVKPIASVITHIGYDHTKKLGTRLLEIAYEKAGIIKPNTPLVTTWQRKDVLKMLKKRCLHLNSKIFVLGNDFFFDKVRFRKDYTLFDFNHRERHLKNLEITLKGKHQVENAALAIATLESVKDRLAINKHIDFKGGLKKSSIEGRFEIINNDPLVILDIAHNVSSFSALASSLNAYFPKRKVILIFAASSDKNIRGMLRCIKYGKLILTSFNNPRSSAPGEIKKRCLLKNATLTEDIREAFDVACKFYTRRHLILISGSLFLVAEAKKLFQ